MRHSNINIYEIGKQFNPSAKLSEEPRWVFIIGKRIHLNDFKNAGLPLTHSAQHFEKCSKTSKKGDVTDRIAEILKQQQMSYFI